MSISIDELVTIILSEVKTSPLIEVYSNNLNPHKSDPNSSYPIL